MAWLDHAIMRFREITLCHVCKPCHRSDSGGASYLGQVWAAACEWRDSGNFQLESIPRLELQVVLQPLTLLPLQQHTDKVLQLLLACWKRPRLA